MIPTKLINSHYVIPTNNPGRLKPVFPAVKEAEVNGQTWCAVPQSLDSARVLTNLGFKVDSPIRTEYKWPGRYTPRWYQEDTADFFTLNPRGFCLSAPRCVDKETEFLTPSGWKKLPEYTPGNEVAQWNPETKAAEFVRPLEYVDMPCEEFVHIKTASGIDQMLTRNHRVPYYSAPEGGKLKEKLAHEILSIDQNTLGWRGKLPVTFKAPYREGLPLTTSELRLMVAVIADGYFPPNNTNRVVVRLKKQRKKSRLRELLGRAGVAYKAHDQECASATGFTVFSFYAPRKEKDFSSWWPCTPAQLAIVLDEVRHWDSCERKAGAFCFSTTVKESADFVQFAASASGRVASLNTTTRERRGRVETEYTVHVRSHGNHIGITGGHSTGNVSEVTLPGERCYCFSVPSTYFVARRNGCVFVTGNTGKTLSALWAADYLKSQGKIRSTLILAPLSTLDDVWVQNIFESFPMRTFAVLHGPRNKRLELLAKQHDYYIVNHHGIGIIEEALAHRPDIDLVIVDEVAEFRNSRTKTLWKPLNRVLNKQGVARWAWGLTGTPTDVAVTDAFGQSKLIKPDNYKGAFTSFKNQTMIQVSQFKWVPRKGWEDTVHEALKPSIRFERTVCTDMEPCITYRKAELSKEQDKAYKELCRQSVSDIRGNVITAVHAGALVQKLVQTACGSVYDEDGNVIKLDFGPRLGVLKEMIRQNHEKVVVLVPFTGVLDSLAHELKKDWSVAVVDGSVSKGKRDRIFKDFRNNSDPHIMLAHPKCMSHGLDLCAASLIIWYAPHNKSTWTQASARIDGSRQEVKIDIAHIYATDEERRAYKVIQEQGKMQEVLLGMVKST